MQAFNIGLRNKLSSPLSSRCPCPKLALQPVRRSHVAVLHADVVMTLADVAAIKFVPSPVDGSVIASQLAVIGSSVGLGAYWWFVLVPSERAALAREKRKGGVGEYLKDVKSDPTRKVEQWFYSDWLESSWFRAMSKRGQSIAPAASFTAPASTDEAGQPSTAPGEEADKDDPLSGPGSTNLLQPSYDTPTPKFWSFDNPLVAAMVLIMGMGFSSYVYVFVRGVLIRDVQ